MRRILSYMIVLGAAFLCGGCSGGGFSQPETEAVVTYAVSAADRTRAEHDGDGAAAHVTRYICEVYSDGVLYKRMVKVVPEGTAQTSFECRLMVMQDYEVLFWADSSDGADDLYYTTSDGLRSVSLAGGALGNNDALDAFCARDEIKEFSADKWKDVTLRRPFAQLNLITDDVDVIRNSEALGEDLVPDRVSLSFQGPTLFDVSTGAVSGVKNLNYSADVYYRVIGADEGPYYTLAMNYIFASDIKDVQEIGFCAMNGMGEVSSGRFSNIPLQRNYRTNIIGSLLTVKSSWRVVIAPEWERPGLDLASAQD